jgi:hypothetical protein
MNIDKKFDGFNPVPFMVVTGLLVVALLIGLWVFLSAMEARAFNRCTGKNVSTWDAMWIELRVMEPSK